MRDAYLERVGLSAFPPATADGLRTLHAAQSHSIPFENLTVLCREPVKLDLGSLFAKLVARRRGGYCFELNGLFAWAMKEAGFHPQTHLGRVRMHRPQPGPLTHQLSLVEAGGRTWLADVGFGGPGIRFPMPLEHGRIDLQDGEEFRLSPDPDFGNVLELRQQDGNWLSTYYFQQSRIQPEDIELGNHFTSTGEQSVFRKGPMLSRNIPGGKITLFGRELRRWTGPASSMEKIDPECVGHLLGDVFGIELEAEKVDLVKSLMGKME